MMTDCPVLMNALTDQRNDLAAMIENAEDARDLGAAETALRMLTGVWDAVGYGYKVVEMRGRIKDKARRLADEGRQLLAGLRKNDRIRGHLVTDIGRLETLQAAI